MKLYTRRGDDGDTDLFGAGRASKADPRIIAIGDVDETNAVLGLAVSACNDDVIKPILLEIQSRLFDLGADLASTKPDQSRRINPTHIASLETQIDAVCENLPDLKNFILPGGCEPAARLHLARTVCRRAERACVILQAQDTDCRDTVVFLNRLSDLLFALARIANQHARIEDIPWNANTE